MDDQTSAQEQFEMKFFADLAPLDDLERKINNIIEYCERTRDLNAELKEKIRALENTSEQQNQMIEELANKNRELTHAKGNPQRDNIIREKIQSILSKLEDY